MLSVFIGISLRIATVPLYQHDFHSSLWRQNTTVFGVGPRSIGCGAGPFPQDANILQVNWERTNVSCAGAQISHCSSYAPQ
jgi:hypothetical protein